MQLTLCYHDRIGADMIDADMMDADMMDADMGVDMHACMLVCSHAPVTTIFKSRENTPK